MSSASASAPVHGFVTVRGRGYRREQVDGCAAALSRERDAAWERAARLTVLARTMGEDLAGLRETVAGLAPQTYEALGGGAPALLRGARKEADALRERARADGERLVAEARAYAADATESARAHADAVRAEADVWARQRLLAARAEADEVRIGARREVKAGRGAVLGVLREARRRTADLLAEQAGEQAARWAAAEREDAERAAAVEERAAESLARAERLLADAGRDLADAEETARRLLEEARARAADVLAGARAYEERVARETERVLREHGERWDAVQAQTDRVRSRLSALTGRAAK